MVNVISIVGKAFTCCVGARAAAPRITDNGSPGNVLPSHVLVISNLYCAWGSQFPGLCSTIVTRRYFISGSR